MSKITVSEFTDNGITSWGLFYNDARGVRRHLTEDFKPLVFKTERAAREKLDAIESERRSEDSAAAFSPEEARDFVDKQKWKFAATYAKTAPHEYLVKRWLPQEERSLFERLVQTIKEYAVVGYFYGHKNEYLILGDHYYWYMDYPENMAVDLINRTTTDHLEYREGAYYYKRQGI